VVSLVTQLLERLNTLESEAHRSKIGV